MTRFALITAAAVFAASTASANISSLNMPSLWFPSKSATDTATKTTGSPVLSDQG